MNSSHNSRNFPHNSGNSPHNSVHPRQSTTFWVCMMCLRCACPVLHPAIGPGGREGISSALVFEARRDIENSPHNSKNSPHNSKNSPHNSRNSPHNSRNSPHNFGYSWQSATFGVCTLTARRSCLVLNLAKCSSSGFNELFVLGACGLRATDSDPIPNGSCAANSGGFWPIPPTSNAIFEQIECSGALETYFFGFLG